MPRPFAAPAISSLVCVFSLFERRNKSTRRIKAAATDTPTTACTRTWSAGSCGVSVDSAVVAAATTGSFVISFIVEPRYVTFSTFSMELRSPFDIVACTDMRTAATESPGSSLSVYKRDMAPSTTYPLLEGFSEGVHERSLRGLSSGRELMPTA